MRGSLLVLCGLSVVAMACAPTPQPPEGGAPGLLPSVQATTDGDTVRFVLQVTNTTGAPVELEFSSGQAFDFVVLDGDREVWRWSADQMFTQALREERLAPGATLTFEAEWVPQGATPGEYTVVGRLTARDRPVEQRARFRVD